MTRKHLWPGLAITAVIAAGGVLACNGDDDGGGGTPSATRHTTATAAISPTQQAQPTASAVTTATVPAAVVDALTEAVNEEYKAHATYQAVVDKFGEVGPFPNIVKSEQSHIDAWKQLFTKYGLTIPADPYLGKVAAPATLREACETGVAAEKEDVTLYDRLLKTVTEPDIVAVMEQQRRVSQENHLPALERC